MPQTTGCDHGVAVWVKKDLANDISNYPRLSDHVGDLIPLREVLYCNAQIICCIATWMRYGWSP